MLIAVNSPPDKADPTKVVGFGWGESLQLCRAQPAVRSLVQGGDVHQCPALGLLWYLINIAVLLFNSKPFMLDLQLS